MPIDIHCQGCNKTLRIADRHAGKKVKCPGCASVLDVPIVAELDDEGIVETIPVATFDVRPLPDEEAGGRYAARPPRQAPRRSCPECGERVPEQAYRCPECRAILDEDEDDDYDDDYDDRPRSRKTRVSFVSCPKCNAPDPKRVTWTAWGSFYGPAMFNHVRCRECGYAYNGRSGGSNVLPAIIFVTIPALLILGIISFVIFMIIVPSLR